jgi:hypothetical protein
VSDISVVEYEPGRRDEVLELLDRVRGYRTPPGELEWWFDGNPVKPRLLFLAQAGDALAGVLGASLYRSVVSGREGLVAVPLWAVTDDAFRGRGIFQALNHAIERRSREARVAVELGFTNRLAGPIYIAKLGWSDVHRLRLWGRLLRPARATGLAASSDFERFGSEQEEAYRRAAPALPSHFVRDAAYLDWRFASDARSYVRLATDRGYAVLGSKTRGRLLTAAIADLVAPPESFRATRSLLRRCIRAARGADVLLSLMPVPAAQRRAFLAAGFVPTPTTIRLIGKGLGQKLPLGPRAWHFTLVDTDFFL